MIRERFLAYVDIAVAVAILVLLLPASMWLSHQLADRCTSSATELQRATFIWWFSAFVATAAAYYFLRLPLRRILSRVAFVICFVVLIGLALPSLDFGSLDRSRQKRTMADIRTLEYELENLRSENGAYPNLKTVTDLQRTTKRRTPTTDGWGNAFELTSNSREYTVVSRGLCGQPDRLLDPGEFNDVHGDIVFTNGRFSRYPVGMSTN